METTRNYSILLSVSDAVREGKYFSVEGYLEYCPHCGWLQEPVCPHAGSEQAGSGFNARLIRSVNGTEEVFVLLMGTGAESALVLVPWDVYKGKRENLRRLILDAISRHLPSWMTDELLPPHHTHVRCGACGKPNYPCDLEVCYEIDRVGKETDCPDCAEGYRRADAE